MDENRENVVAAIANIDYPSKSVQPNGPSAKPNCIRRHRHSKRQRDATAAQNRHAKEVHHLRTVYFFAAHSPPEQSGTPPTQSCFATHRADENLRNVIDNGSLALNPAHEALLNSQFSMICSAPLLDEMS
jgi:hypothetical protein